MQHESQELAAWLACHQNAALKQLKKLRSILESAQSMSSATADHVQRHQTNIGMLAQKEQQYALQLQTLEDKLATAKYSPLVNLQASVFKQARCLVTNSFGLRGILIGLCFAVAS